MNLKRLVIVMSVGMGTIATLALLWLLGSPGTSVIAAPVLNSAERPLSGATSIHYVAITGTNSGDCSTPASACRTIQRAVDWAGEGDEIHIASGVYTDVNVRPRDDVTTTGIVTQIVYISKTLTIQGGYTTTNSFVSQPNPISYPTTLDAQGQGRVLYITGDISPTVEGLRITGGDATGLGSMWAAEDCGAGIFVITATATISNNWIYSNNHGHGVGLCSCRSNILLGGNIISNNVTADTGGGLYLYSSDATLRGNIVVANTAGSTGGGLYIWGSAATLTGNIVTSNTASGDGGGLYIWGSVTTLTGNEVTSNTAAAGGGLFLLFNAHMLTGNTVANNVASSGGGLVLLASDPTLVNNLIVGNRANTGGSGVSIAASSPRLLHNTIADNTGGDSGVYLTQVWEAYSTAVFTNTVLTSHTVGIAVTAGNTATLNSVLWYGNGTNASGPGTITITNEYTGSPAFVDPDARDYHIGATSAARDGGVSAGVLVDIDGEPRDVFPDLGADEYSGGCHARLNDGVIYSNVQAAVDASSQPSDVVKVAGYCFDVHVRSRNDVTTTGVVTQVVYISKTVTIQGGYTTTNGFAGPPDPISYPTTLDAQGQGRVLYITGDISPTVEGLRITGGDAIGLGGESWLGGDCGGGVYVISAKATISNNLVFSNTATHYGGGLYLHYSAATISGNTISTNTVNWRAGGLCMLGSAATLDGNTITHNSATDGGGGLLLSSSSAMLNGNIVYSNTAGRVGGGLWLNRSAATFSNSLVVDNQASSQGSGLYIDGSSPRLLHTTIARNSGGDGSGVYVTADGFGNYSTIYFANTILVSHKVGITVREGNTATLNGVLWYGNGANANGPGTITITNEHTDSPAFVDPDAGNYHIGTTSAARDRGTSAGVLVDIDGEPRDVFPDLGADEYSSGCHARLNDGVIYSNVQTAVDASTQPSDVVKVAGYCSDVHVRSRNDVTTTGVVTQVVYISKTLTLQGGWNISFTQRNVISYPTTLDAQGQGRLLYITGDISPTIEGLRITGGNANGLGGGPWGWEAGGGVYVITATAIIKDNQIFNNTAYWYGGGLYLVSSDAILTGNTVTSNTAERNGGGGIYLRESPAVLSGNTVISNTASEGGGLFLLYSPATLSGNVVFSNTGVNGGGLFLDFSGATLNDNDISFNSAYVCGGLCVNESDATLTGNTVFANTARGAGGGLLAYSDNVILSGNTVLSNTADRGGGLFLVRSNVKLTNNVIADNWANSAGGGLYIEDSSSWLSHNTISRNSSGDGSGMYVTNYWSDLHSVAILTNTILASHSVGISVTGGNTVVVNGILWHNTPITISQAVTATVTAQNQHTGDPAFVDPDAENYHIGVASAATDMGVDAGVSDDINGDPRPMGRSPDLGADELGIAMVVSKQATPDPVQSGTPLTYTIQITNNGLVTLTAAVTDTLLPGETSSGALLLSDDVLTWTNVTITPGNVWMTQFTITVGAGYAGTLTNVVQVTTDEGARATVTETAFANIAPVADAGPDLYVVESDAVLLDGSGSTDPDGHLPLAYRWKRTGGPFIILVDADKAQAAFQSPPYQSALTFTLTVTDSLGLSSEPDTIIVYVGIEPPSNQSPYTPSNPNPRHETTNIPLTQTLNWRGGDPDDQPVTYTLGFGDISPPPVVVIDLITTTYDPGLLLPHMTYYWAVTATDGISITRSAVWRFTTVTEYTIYLPIILHNY